MAEGVVGLERFQLIERAVEGAFEAGFVLGQPVGSGVEQVEARLEDANAAQVPGCRDEFFKQSVLDGACRPDLRLIGSEEIVEFLNVVWLDGQLFREFARDDVWSMGRRVAEA